MDCSRDRKIEESVDRYIKQHDLDLRREYSEGVYHVSDLIGFNNSLDGICYRQAYFKYRMPESEFNRERAGIFEMGRTLELKLGEDLLPKAGYEIVEKQPTVEHTFKGTHRDIKLVGHIDFVVTRPPDPTRFVAEIKSVRWDNREMFQNYCKENSDPKKVGYDEDSYPKPPNALQCSIYSWLKELYGKLIYISKSDLSCRGWDITPNINDLELIKHRADRLDGYLFNNQIPTGQANWSCLLDTNRPKSYCEYFNSCRELGKYMPKPKCHGYCKKCKLIIAENMLRTNPEGYLICFKCGNRIARQYK